jgi:flagellar hook-basal body complex protein FliE
MTGFDLPPLSGFDVSRFQRDMLRGMEQNLPGVKAPEGRAPRALDGVDATASPGGSFEGALADSLAAVSGLQADVRAKTRGLVMGEDVELHDVMIAANKSETAFNLMLEVRNKLVDAWEKLSRSVM